jgi:hypothetical protein
MDQSIRSPDGHDLHDELKGFEVFTSDDEKLGTVEAVLAPQTTASDAAAGQILRVEPGLIQKCFGEQEDIFVSESMIASVEPDANEVILNVPRERLDGER